MRNCAKKTREFLKLARNLQEKKTARNVKNGANYLVAGEQHVGKVVVGKFKVSLVVELHEGG